MKPRRFLKHFSLLAVVLSSLNGCAAAPTPVSGGGARLSAAQIDRVGRRIWQNECGGTVAGLTSWNAGEAFASLGVGHFIWYPQGQSGPFEESFPPLVAFLQSRGMPIPAWMQGGCPWPTKAAFEADRNGARQKELRTLLSQTVRQQTEFIMVRMERALPKMLAAAKDPAAVRSAFDALKATPEGTFCLIDYVNFKGEGTSSKERYQGQGWGLLQVLEGIPKQKAVWHYPGEFAESAKRVLSRRVANAPSERNEQRWLAGWHSRCDGYKKSL
ncbi:MAG: hypothetical protein ACKVY0_23570 [Prosthecobacter sp.]|uniref:hypothetical protein n=1 Tax=Prosthecobacter sp. TaxID=1965333 RepID=UPI0039032217